MSPTAGDDTARSSPRTDDPMPKPNPINFCGTTYLLYATNNVSLRKGWIVGNVERNAGDGQNEVSRNDREAAITVWH